MRRAALIMMGAFALAAAPAALAALSTNTVERDVEREGATRRVKVVVLLGCDRVQRARLRVTLTQGPPDAVVAQGRRTIRCVGETRRFPVRVTPRRGEGLTTGAATACVLATTHDDARQWCRKVRVKAPRIIVE